MSSHLLSKNIKSKTYRTIILPVVLYDYEILSLILRGKQTPRVFQNRVLRRIWTQVGCNNRKLEKTA
jgi:hypothetical protein